MYSYEVLKGKYKEVLKRNKELQRDNKKKEKQIKELELIINWFRERRK